MFLEYVEPHYLIFAIKFWDLKKKYLFKKYLSFYDW